MPRHQVSRARPSLLTQAVQGVFRLVSLAEFEILFVAFFLIVFLWVKELTSHPDYNQIFVKKSLPGELGYRRPS